MKLTDYVAAFLENQGVKDVFGLTGGAVVHLFDSLNKNSGITTIFTHHEQAAALAAVAYARIRNDLGVAFVTTAPGSTNTITGVLAAWMDSISCVFISGQARTEHTSRGKPIRQLGSQELDIVSLVSHITKYAAMVEEPKKIKYYLEKAVYIARNGRPGPVWLDIPLNIQWESIEPNNLPGFDPSLVKEEKPSKMLIDKSIQKSVELLLAAKRPLVLAGYGIRLSGAALEFQKFIEKLKIPFVSSWNASDLLPTDNPLYAGRIGVAGQRGGNLAMQNCDLLLALGSHLCINITGTNYGAFAREAKIVVVDIDPVELGFQTVRVDVPIQCDVKEFLQKLSIMPEKEKYPDISWWREKCLNYKSYNAVQSEWRVQKEYVNPYVFIDVLSDELGNDDIIAVDGGGTTLYMSFQGCKIKRGQRLIVSAGIASMGTGLPESIGACIANGRKRTICMIGDGSMQLNIQELQTIVHYNLPIKIFVFNNGGYLAIRQTQDAFLNSNYVGSSNDGGVSMPDFQKVANAYGIKAVRVSNNRELLDKVQSVLQESNPVLCEIMISPDQELIPRIGFKENLDGTFSSRPLEDMYPYLERNEFLENMVVKPLD